MLLTLLMYVEMSISSLLVNKTENKLIKGPAYHLNFLVMALLVLVFSFLGLPFATGSLPHSPQFVRALSDVEEISVAGQTKTRVLWVRENRLPQPSALNPKP
jgi:sodium borate transporter 11